MVTTVKMFERIHLDYAGSIKNKMYLIITNVYSKWVKVFEVNSASIVNALKCLDLVFRVLKCFDMYSCTLCFTMLLHYLIAISLPYCYCYCNLR